MWESIEKIEGRHPEAFWVFSMASLICVAVCIGIIGPKALRIYELYLRAQGVVAVDPNEQIDADERARRDARIAAQQQWERDHGITRNLSVRF